jgi:hypothetical protein
MNMSWLKIVVGILTVALFLSSCAKRQTPTPSTAEPNRPAQPKVVAPEPSAREANAPTPTTPAAKPAPADPNIVAEIGDYTITGDEFKKEYIRQIQPNPYSGNPIRPALEPEAVLKRMLGDKAILLEAREQGMHKKDEIQVYIKRIREQRLATKAVLAAIEPQIVVTEQDVNDQITKNPKLTREQASAMARRQKGNQAFEKYYTQVVERLHLRKVAENLPKAAALHKRLLSKPKQGNVYWIQNDQIKNDLDPNEKALVLTTYDGGTFTVKDWFEALCEMAPPGRPKDLDTPEGVERFLDRAVQRPLLTAEAVARGMDKDEKLNKDLRKMEDDMVFGYAQQERLKGLVEPNDQDIAATYEKVKDTYARNDRLKLDVIWCENRAAAAKSKAEIDQGKDFKTVQQQVTIDKKRMEPIDSYPGNEGLFWQDLWTSEPNQVIGPIQGFREGSLGWRIVKVIEKNPGQQADFNRAKGMIKSDLVEQRQQALLDKVRADLLQKLHPQVFADRLAAFDPRNVP